MFGKKKIEDNTGKVCHPLRQSSEDGGLSLTGTCSLCGRKLSLWPYADRTCSWCGATVEHPIERGE